MAISQAKSDKKGVGIFQKSVDGFSVFEMGGIQFATGSGAPNNGASGDLKSSPKGSLYVDVASGKLYAKTSASGATVAWGPVGAQTA